MAKGAEVNDCKKSIVQHLTAPTNLCSIYRKARLAGVTITEYMYKNFRVNLTKIKGGCQMVMKVAQLISYRNFPLLHSLTVNSSAIVVHGA